MFKRLKLTHADNGATVVQDNPISLQTVSTLTHNLGNTLVKGIAEGDVGNNSLLKVGPGANTLGTVDDLVGDDKVAGLDSLLQTADGGEGDDASDTNGAQSSDVGAGGDFMRGDLVVSTVTAQESHGDSLVIVLALVVQDGDRRGGFTPGSVDGQRSHLGETRQLTQSSTANDSNWDRP